VVQYRLGAVAGCRAQRSPGIPQTWTVLGARARRDDVANALPVVDESFFEVTAA